MTRLEWMRTASAEKIAEFLCNETLNVVEECEQCPASGMCKKGHTGYIDWLNEEVKQNETSTNS